MYLAIIFFCSISLATAAHHRSILLSPSLLSSVVNLYSVFRVHKRRKKRDIVSKDKRLPQNWLNQITHIDWVKLTFLFLGVRSVGSREFVRANRYSGQVDLRLYTFLIRILVCVTGTLTYHAQQRRITTIIWDSGLNHPHSGIITHHQTITNKFSLFLSVPKLVIQSGN